MNDPDPIAETLELARALPAGAVAAVFRRYGKPLEAPLPPIAPDDQLAELRPVDDGGAAATLRAFQVRTAVDVVANDWFVLETAAAEPLAIPGPLFAAAVAALSRPPRR